MTEILAHADNDHYSITASNHAGSHDACVMVSAIMYALAGAIKTNPQVDVLGVQLHDGYAKIEYLSKHRTGEEDFRMAVVGLMQVELAYPDDIIVHQNIIF